MLRRTSSKQQPRDFSTTLNHSQRIRNNNNNTASLVTQTKRFAHGTQQIENFLSNKKNVDFDKSETGAFGVSEAVSPKTLGRWQLEIRKILEHAQNTNQQGDAAISEFDTMFKTLYNARDTLKAIGEFHPNEDFVTQATRIHKAVEGMIKTLVEAQHIFGMVKASNSKAAKYMMHEFEEMGAHLPEDKRRLVVGIQDQLVLALKHLEESLSPKHGFRMLKPMRFSEQEMARSVYNTIPKLRLKRKRWGDISYANHSAEILRVSKHHDIRKNTHDNLVKHLTEEVYPALDQVLEARHEVARALGFNNWGSMISERAASVSDQDTKAKLQQVAKKLRDPVREQSSELRKVRQDHQEELDVEKVQLDRKHKHRPRPRKDPIPDLAQPLDAHDLWYYQQVPFRALRKEASEYFTLQSIFQGTLNVMEQLFDIEFRISQFSPGETWDILNTRKIDVYDRSSNRSLGTLYFDLFDRPGKTHTARAHVNHQYIERGDRTAVLVTGTGLPIPLEGLPHTLEFHEAHSLFQQLGTAFASLLWAGSPGFFARESWAEDVSGTLPALLDNMFYQSAVLGELSGHFQGGSKLSVEMKFNLQEHRNKWAAMELLSDTTVALQDIALHETSPGNVGEAEFSVPTLGQVTAKHHDLMPLVPDLGRVRSYDGKQYARMMSRVYAVQLLHTVKGDDFLPKIGSRLREAVFSVGATAKPKDVVKTMLGGEADTRYLFAEFNI